MKLSWRIYTAYGSFALFLSMLHNIFLLYHVETFVSIYNIDQTAFFIGETIFLLWNSVNDPLFGWLSDNSYLKQSTKVTGNKIIIKRIKILLKTSPLFALSFMLFWYLWFPVGLQFVVCLCLYDSFLTLLDLQHSALLADLAISASIRANFNTFNALFSCLGSTSVFLSYVFWNRNDPKPFRMFCFSLAFISTIGFTISCVFLNVVFQGAMSRSPEYENKKNEISNYSDTVHNIVSFVRQLVKNTNFLWFTGMNLIQVFNCHFNSNFFPLFLEALLSGIFSPRTASLLLGTSFLAPHINNLFFLHLCHSWGVYRVVKYLFLTKMILSLVMWILGPTHIYMLSLFIVSNRIFTEGTCKLLNLVISDLVDEDMVLNNRPHAVSAIIFGTSSFLSKPGQAFAPILGMCLLSWLTGNEEPFNGLITNQNVTILREYEQMHTSSEYKDVCFWLLVNIPLVCAMLQLVAWAQFTLHGEKLNRIKYLRVNIETGRYEQKI